ncbi:MAG: hypothetical protein ACR2G6_07310 [Gemmatimonadaceae bacterium]
MRGANVALFIATAALILGSLPLQSQPATTRIRPLDRARIERVLGSPAPSDTSRLKVVSRAGVQLVSPAADTIRVAAGDFVFRKIGAEVIRDTTQPLPPPYPVSLPEGALPDLAVRVESRRTYELPYRWFTVDTNGVERLLIPKLIVDQNGLTYRTATRQFSGWAHIGVEDSLHPAEGSQPLARPLKMQLHLTGPGKVVPNRLEIDHTSLDYDSIEISARDSVTVRIRTATDPDGVLIPVQVYRPSVKLYALPSVLQAFGLGTSVVSVTLPPGHARGDTIMVTFPTQSLNVRPAVLAVTADEPNEAKIRSGMPGRHTISADVNGTQADAIDVTFVWPWLFLSAAVAGLAVGGAATYFGDRSGKPTNIGTAILKGAPFGLLTAVAAALGLDWLGLHLDDAGTWMGVMLTAALGAYAGERVLERVTGGGGANG